MRYPPVRHRHVLITGCSSGIGAAAAHVLRSAGWTVYPTARKEADLEALRSAGFDALALDVAETDAVARAAHEVLERTGGALGALVNNAGFGQPGAVEDVSREALRYQFEVNLFGAQDLTNRLLPALRAQGCGRVVNISSVVGRVAIPFYGVYAATKFAMEALSDAMRVELRGTGVAVTLVEPGPIATRFGDNSVEHAETKLDMAASRFGRDYRRVLDSRKTGGSKNLFRLPPEAVARKILHALESPRPRRRYCVTLPAYVGALLGRFAPPALLDLVMANRWGKRTSPAQAAS